MNRILKIVLWISLILIVLILVVVIAFQVSPKPGAMLIGNMFNGEVAITDKRTYDKAVKKVSVLLNESYKSEFHDNTYDIYYPKNDHEPTAVLIWIHGGGYVGGDKRGAKEFAVKLVSDANIAVVSMNYEVAPDSQYPNQVIQVGELIKELKSNKYKVLNMSKLFFGGDSAGAQIALQYVATQTNPKYAREVGIDRVLAKESIRGVVSYCGPVDLKQSINQKTEDKLMKFFIKTVAWSLIGTKEWQKDVKLFQASLVNKVTADFPATYITDGNTYSFQNQGISFAKRLNQLDVPVESLFYKDLKEEIVHEYQFDYTTNESKECYKQTLSFINQYKT